MTSTDLLDRLEIRIFAGRPLGCSANDLLQLIADSRELAAAREEIERVTKIAQARGREMDEVKEDRRRLREESTAWQRELSLCRAVVRNYETDRDERDRYKRFLEDIGKKIGCGHIDERLSNCAGEYVGNLKAEIERLRRENAELRDGREVDAKFFKDLREWDVG